MKMSEIYVGLLTKAQIAELTKSEKIFKESEDFTEEMAKIDFDKSGQVSLAGFSLIWLINNGENDDATDILKKFEELDFDKDG